MTNKEIKDKPPSLDLAYEWVKDVLDSQVQDAESLITRAVTMFSVDTAIMGFVFPLTLFSSTVKLSIFPFGIIALALYAVLIILTVYSLVIRGFISLKNPIIIREWYWNMETQEFRMELLTHLEDAFTKNQARLAKRGYALQAIAVITGLEVLFVFLFLLPAF